MGDNLKILTAFDNNLTVTAAVILEQTRSFEVVISHFRQLLNNLFARFLIWILDQNIVCTNIVGMLQFTKSDSLSQVVLIKNTLSKSSTHEWAELHEGMYRHSSFNLVLLLHAFLQGVSWWSGYCNFALTEICLISCNRHKFKIPNFSTFPLFWYLIDEFGQISKNFSL